MRATCAWARLTWASATCSAAAVLVHRALADETLGLQLAAALQVGARDAGLGLGLLQLGLLQRVVQLHQQLAAAHAGTFGKAQPGDAAAVSGRSITPWADFSEPTACTSSTEGLASALATSTVAGPPAARTRRTAVWDHGLGACRAPPPCLEAAATLACTPAPGSATTRPHRQPRRCRRRPPGYESSSSPSLGAVSKTVNCNDVRASSCTWSA
jgi:hypothetical protein